MQVGLWQLTLYVAEALCCLHTRPTTNTYTPVCRCT
jgi:hypothetical protein